MTAQSMSFGQELRQRQAMAMSQQMRHSLELLAMDSLELRQELRHALETNPAIEDVRYGPGETPLSQAAPDSHNADSPADRELNFDATPERMEAILSADDGYRDTFLSGMENAPGDDEADAARTRFLDARLKKPRSLQEHLAAQLPAAGIPQELLPLAAMLVGNIDERGYFRGSVPDICMIARTTPEQVADVLSLIKRLDPPGCGSSSPGEYLEGRLAEVPSALRAGVRAVLRTRPFREADAGSVAQAMRTAAEESGLDAERFAAALAAIRKLDPWPANGFDDGGETVPAVAPEVFLEETPGGGFALRLNGREAPHIRFSETFKRLARRKDLSPEESAYVKSKIAAAAELANAVERRQETILSIADEIVKAQDAFFRTGDPARLRPLTMGEVARATGVHEATVSRTVNGKYIRTPRGTYELRRFFSSGLPKEGGGAAASTAAVEVLKRIVAAEDASAPLSDGALAEKMAAAGMKIARRTVAKYRMKAGIPDAAARKAEKFASGLSESPGQFP